MAEKHNICLLNDSFPPVIDGVANAVTNYAYEIERKHGHAIVATPEVPGADDSGFPFPVIRYPSLDTRNMVGYVTGLPYSPELAMKLKEEDVRLLHSHCPVASTILARKLRETMDIPLVLTYHTMFDREISKALHSRILQGEALIALTNNLNACDEVWAVSRGAGESLREIGYTGELVVMDNGVDLPRERVSREEIAQVTEGFDLPEDVPVFLFVGRLMWYKGIRIIIDALKRLKEQGKDFRMVFIGSGGDEAEIKEYSSGLGMDDRILFIGTVRDREDLRAWYCRADLFLFPSVADTNGLVVREAAACSLASVLVKDSCAAEGVAGGRNGFLIEEDAASLADLLSELHGRKDLMRKVGEAASKELYLSWADAVSRANERYGIVIENYRTGKYRPHISLTDGFFLMSGMLMEIMGHVGEIGKNVSDIFVNPIDHIEKWFDLE